MLSNLLALPGMSEESLWHIRHSITGRHSSDHMHDIRTLYPASLVSMSAGHTCEYSGVIHSGRAGIKSPLCTFTRHLAVTWRGPSCSASVTWEMLLYSRHSLHSTHESHFMVLFRQRALPDSWIYHAWSPHSQASRGTKFGHRIQSWTDPGLAKRGRACTSDGISLTEKATPGIRSVPWSGMGLFHEQTSIQSFKCLALDGGVHTLERHCLDIIFILSNKSLYSHTYAFENMIKRAMIDKSLAAMRMSGVYLHSAKCFGMPHATKWNRPAAIPGTNSANTTA